MIENLVGCPGCIHVSRGHQLHLAATLTEELGLATCRFSGADAAASKHHPEVLQQSQQGVRTTDLARWAASLMVRGARIAVQSLLD